MKLAAAILALAVVTAAPAVAQMPPPPGEAGLTGTDRMHAGNPMFAGMSEAGRATMRAAMRDADPRQGRALTDAARDRMLAILDADRFDAVALKRAMDDEREASNAAKARHQAALIAGLQQLSPADRRIFVVNARAVWMRVQDRMANGRGRRGPGGPGPGAVVPPPQ